MARTTVPLLFIDYRQIDDPLVKDVFASITIERPFVLEELSLEARLQIARHLRELAVCLEAGKALREGPRALLIHTETGPLLAYKDPP